jgi:hypothetical protein
MDLLLLILIVLLVLSLGGWGYGYYTRPAPAGDVVAAPAAGMSLLGVLALIFLVAIVLMLVTGWHPLGPVW